MRNYDEVKRIKGTFLPGMRVRLVEMDDFQAPPIGCMGTVLGVDDIGSVMVAWDNGSMQPTEVLPTAIRLQSLRKE